MTRLSGISFISNPSILTFRVGTQPSFKQKNGHPYPADSNCTYPADFQGIKMIKTDLNMLRWFQMISMQNFHVTKRLCVGTNIELYNWMQLWYDSTAIRIGWFCTEVVHRDNGQCLYEIGCEHVCVHVFMHAKAKVKVKNIYSTQPWRSAIIRSVASHLNRWCCI